ncbi:MAG: RNA-metabolising metallo-beta-lactamase, metallo-beta-lactamase family protein [Candidatus Adlerbacteria bacterium]|nr:RNA-metabolising metallo-beta-lactamase, metallo-beta-lactamase family protein [Candidatus Adlerbacteria bacterium]
MQSTLTFYGGAGSVTGSNFMLDTGGAKFLIDCGFEQGVHEEDNYKPFAYDVKAVSHLFISHAHLDHVGRIPFLVKSGFTGKIVSTHATRSLAEFIMRDALSLMIRAVGHGGREPLYAEQDIDHALKLWEERGLHEPLELPDGMTHEFYDAGHILGSAMSRFSRADKSLVVTGDLGGGNSPLLPLTEALPNPDYLVIESVYGDRVRQDDSHRREDLENVIEATVLRGGTLLIPAFSTERTQDLVFEIRSLMTGKMIPSVPVFLDSPLAEKITAAFEDHPEYFSREIQDRVAKGEKIFSFPEMKFARDQEESRLIQSVEGPKIILAGSGMSNGGRVLSHERYVLPDPASTLLIVGYQAAGTIGRRLLEGEKELHVGKEVIPVRAHVETLYGYSAHRDGAGLMELVEACAGTLTQVFVVEGEPAAAGFLTQRIRDYLAVKATAPGQGDSATIEL